MTLHRPAIALLAALLLPACVDFSASEPKGTPPPLDEPRFSHDSGFYETDISVGLSHTDPTVAVYYTLDGSEPDPGNVNGTTYRYKLTYPRKPGDASGTFHEQTYQSLRYKHRIAIERFHNPALDARNPISSHVH